MNITINLRRDHLFLDDGMLHVHFDRSGLERVYQAVRLPASGWRVVVDQPPGEDAKFMLKLVNGTEVISLDQFATLKLAEKARERIKALLKRSRVPVLKIAGGVMLLSVAWAAVSFANSLSVKSFMTRSGMNPVAAMAQQMAGSQGGETDLAALNEQLGALMSSMPGRLGGGMMPSRPGGQPAAQPGMNAKAPAAGYDPSQDIADNPLDYAIFYGPGLKQATPEKTLYVFSDPLCPYCADMETGLKLLPKDVAVRIMPVAIKDGADKIVRNIMCAADPAKAWRAHFDGQKVKDVASCEKADRAMKSNYALFKTLNFNATPAMATGDKKTHQGALHLPEVLDFMGIRQVSGVIGQK